MMADLITELGELVIVLVPDSNAERFALRECASLFGMREREATQDFIILQRPQETTP